MQINTQSLTATSEPNAKSHTLRQLFTLNKLQLSSLAASATVLTAGYFALPAPKATPVVVKASPTALTISEQARLLAAPLPIRPTSLATISENKQLRVATVNDGTTYYLNNEVDSNFAHGYGYDVARRYAHKLKVDLKIIAYDNEQLALVAVMAGKADIALTNNTEALTNQTMTTTQSHSQKTDGQKPHVKKGKFQNASFQPTQTASATQHTTGSSQTTANMLTSVSLSCNQNFLTQYGLNSHVNWTMPSSATDLASHAKTFLCDSKQIALNKKAAQFYRQTTLDDPYSREHFVSTMQTSLPTFRNAFEQNAKAYDHDWRLLVAMGYQESQLKPDAISPTGVRGLMMLTNDTAEAMGVANRNDPMQSIAGGAKYLAMLNKEFADVPNPDRLWFSLAAYNMGPSAVNAIQNTLNAAGKNGNSWSEVYQFLNQHATENPRYYQCLTYVSHIRGYLDALKTQPQSPEKTLSSV